MPQYQTEASISLLVFSAISFTATALRVSKGRRISLATNGTNDSLQKDPFDLTNPEYMAEGTPINGDAFLASARRRKFAIAFIVTCILILNVISGAFQAQKCGGDIVVAASSTIFALYLLLSSLYSLKQDDIHQHQSMISQFAALFGLATIVIGASTIIPSSSPVIAQLGIQDQRLCLGVQTVWYIQLFLYAVAFVVAITTPLGPILSFPKSNVYAPKTAASSLETEGVVCGVTGASYLGRFLFSYANKVIALGYRAGTFEIVDLPMLPRSSRALVQFTAFRNLIQARNWKPKAGSGLGLLRCLFRLNIDLVTAIIFLAVLGGILFYVPYIFLEQLLLYLDNDPSRSHRSWGFVYFAGLSFFGYMSVLVPSQIIYLTTQCLQPRLKPQLCSILFQKTLVRKSVISSSSAPSTKEENPGEGTEEQFSSKAQIMTLMTADVDRVLNTTWNIWTLINVPMELIMGTILLYRLLGVSCLFGLLVSCLFLPSSHISGKVTMKAQNRLMKARDKRISLMNEILGGIRMIKFMAWERCFQDRTRDVRTEELKAQKLTNIMQVLWQGTWNIVPVLVTLVSLGHYTVIQGNTLTPAIAFTSIAIFEEMRGAMTILPEVLLQTLQCLVSLRRIEEYLVGQEINLDMVLGPQSEKIYINAASLTWPRSQPSEAMTPSTPKFALTNLTLDFPTSELTLICGKIGSGKTLLLLSLLGEAELLSGSVVCPRSPPDALLNVPSTIPDDQWIKGGLCAFVPQAAWLQNASIKENILFNLPYNEERYNKVIEACALVPDFDALQDGDETEIGELGINLSGGQKARVSLARAVYSRASTVLLDDVLSAVDAHTAHHLYHKCLKGDVLHGRTVILVSHHIQLVMPGAKYVVVLDNGCVQYQGTSSGLESSPIMQKLVRTMSASPNFELEIEQSAPLQGLEGDEKIEHRDAQTSECPKKDKPTATVLIEEEKRVMGRIPLVTWRYYLKAVGPAWFWILGFLLVILAEMAPITASWWIKTWSGSSLENDGESVKSQRFYIGIYALISGVGLVIGMVRSIILYTGTIRASAKLHESLLESILFVPMRFHDTVSRGRVLNRFGKDLEVIDSTLPEQIGSSLKDLMGIVLTVSTVSYVGGPAILIVLFLVLLLLINVGKAYTQISRDLKRLDSIARSPMYNIFGETIAGASVIRAFGASSKFMMTLLFYVNTHYTPMYWTSVSFLWIFVRTLYLNQAVIASIAIVSISSPSISSSAAGFALSLSYAVAWKLLAMSRRVVAVEQAMVAVERTQEYTELSLEPPEIIEPRPDASWPEQGAIKCEELVVRYAPGLPDVISGLTCEIAPAMKVGVLGRTGSGKSTLALSFFRLVDLSSGRILVDGQDITKVGLRDLRSRLTIIPQDPSLFSGTLRSTLDVFNEYEDAEIYQALRRVHLIPSENTVQQESIEGNQSVFVNLESPVYEGGENFSAGEKQLLCMARALLKRSKVLIMDEATSSVDYRTDELISKTIKEEFVQSTIFTIAHRLRTVIDYDKVMVMDQGKIVEFDQPSVLLRDTNSKFYQLCKATGSQEFATLKMMAGL